MSNERGETGNRPASDMLTDQFVQTIGQQILDVLTSAGLMGPAQRPGLVAADLGRLASAFMKIDDPRVRTECVSLIEAISGSTPR